MTLPEPLLSFWYAYEARNEGAERTPWGVVTTNARYPLVWDANKASVLEGKATLTMAEIRAVLLPALRRVGAHYEFVEFWDLDEESRALRELRQGNESAETDILMVFEGEPNVDQTEGLDVREIREPDEPFWGAYRATRNDFGTTHPSAVVDQLVRRDREMHARGTLRLFVGFVDGDVAGFASLTSFERVGYIDNVVTRPGYRRRGVASTTVARAVEASLSGGDALVHLLADEAGAPRRLYERLGFRPWMRAAGFSRLLPARSR